ncbi:hypothetical protein HMPREF1321_0570 [Capnocytophaga sp. oral taxon 412 str. F0487]|nr:hypothetical protein HMPREF1321_0570 [Capnocytophaga sp. oral taxon 412 str. F0487]
MILPTNTVNSLLITSEKFSLLFYLATVYYLHFIKKALK